MGREAGEGDAEVDVEEPEPDTTGVELYDHVAQGHQPYLASCSSDKEMAASAGTAGRDGPGTEPFDGLGWTCQPGCRSSCWPRRANTEQDVSFPKRLYYDIL